LIPIGEPCKICKKTHIIKPIEIWDDLTPKEKTKGYMTQHRIFLHGYYRSLDRGNEVWEFYLPLTVWKAGWYVKQIKEDVPISEKYAVETYSYYYDED
jgi:hypothetical protein